MLKHRASSVALAGKISVCSILKSRDLTVALPSLPEREVMPSYSQFPWIQMWGFTKTVTELSVAFIPACLGRGQKRRFPEGPGRFPEAIPEAKSHPKRSWKGCPLSPRHGCDGGEWQTRSLTDACCIETPWLMFFNARKREVRPLRASQSLSETFPCTGYKAFYIKGKALRGNRVARIGILSALSARPTVSFHNFKSQNFKLSVQILKTHMLLMCPHCIKFQIARV